MNYCWSSPYTSHRSTCVSVVCFSSIGVFIVFLSGFVLDSTVGAPHIFIFDWHCIVHRFVSACKARGV